MALTLASCGWRANAPGVLKIGIIAPFEGVGRQLGYAILPIVNDGLAYYNENGLLGNYRVTVVALNDDLDSAAAASQARALARDPDVLAVIGTWSETTALTALPVLEEAGIPTLLANPSDELGPTIFSVCPTSDWAAAALLLGARKVNASTVLVTGPDNALRRALLAGAPEAALVLESAPHPCEPGALDNCLVIHAGEAVGAADVLRRWRATGWQGPFLVGPEAARPWFIGQAGTAAQGVRAVVCAGSGMGLSGEDASLQAAATLATAATHSILSALEDVISASARPTRASLAQALSDLALGEGLRWVEVRNQGWVLLPE